MNANIFYIPGTFVLLHFNFERFSVHLHCRFSNESAQLLVSFPPLSQTFFAAETCTVASGTHFRSRLMADKTTLLDQH